MRHIEKLRESFEGPWLPVVLFGYNTEFLHWNFHIEVRLVHIWSTGYECNNCQKSVTFLYTSHV